MSETEELQTLKKENSKLKLEARLRKSLSLELERQKGIVQTAKEEAEKQQKLLQKASDRLSKYSPNTVWVLVRRATLPSKPSKTIANNIKIDDSTNSPFIAKTIE